MPPNNTEFLLGEISAKLDHLKESDDRQHAKIDDLKESNEKLNARLATVEKKAAINGLVSGSVVSVGIAFIKSHLSA